MAENETITAADETTDEKLERLSARVTALEEIVGEEEYEVRYSGEEVDEICDRVTATKATPAQIDQLIEYRPPKYGKVTIKPQMTSGGGTSIANVLAGYTDPRVYLSINDSGSQAAVEWSRSSNNLVISIAPLEPQGLSKTRTYTVNYMIVEGA